MMKRAVVQWTTNNDADLVERKATIVATHEDGKGYDVRFDDNGETFPILNEMIIRSYDLKTVADFINEFAGKGNWHTNTKAVKDLLNKTVSEMDAGMGSGYSNMILTIVGSTKEIEVKLTSKNKAIQYGSEYLVKLY